MHHDNSTPISLYINAYATGVGAICGSEADRTQFPPQLVAEDHPVYHLEVVNAVAAIRVWASPLQCCLVHLHMDNTMAATIFQLGKGRDANIHACAHELWLICVTAHVTLVVSHILGESLTLSVDALSWYHTGTCFHDIVHRMIVKVVTIISPAFHLFQLSDKL